MKYLFIIALTVLCSFQSAYAAKEQTYAEINGNPIGHDMLCSRAECGKDELSEALHGISLGFVLYEYSQENKELFEPTKEEIAAFKTARKRQLESIRKEYPDFQALDSKTQKQIERRLRTTDHTKIRSWKMDKSLYEKYGGDVANTLDGPELLTAHRRLLEEAIKNKKIIIHDKELESGFWDTLATEHYDLYSQEDVNKLFSLPTGGE